MDEQSGRIRARREQKANIFIHNDLSNAAFYFKERVRERTERGDRDGIAFDCLAAVVTLAFMFEAHINFLGWKLLERWKETDSFEVKVKSVYKKLNLKWDKTREPEATIWQLKELRDFLAHGKPKMVEVDEEVIGRPEELERRMDLSAGWEKECTPEFVLSAYAACDDLWKKYIEASGIKLFDTITSGMGGLTFIERVD